MKYKDSTYKTLDEFLEICETFDELLTKLLKSASTPPRTKPSKIRQQSFLGLQDLEVSAQELQEAEFPFQRKFLEIGVPDRKQKSHLRDLYTENGQTLQGSFSAVSKPTFASEY